MIGKAEDPPRYLLLGLPPSVLRLGKPGKSTSEYSMFMTGWFVILPTNPRSVVVWIEHTADCKTRVGKREIVEISLGWENPAGALADVSKNTRRWIHDQEV